MSDLKEDLDRALRTATFGEAPVEQAKRQGRRIRTRRRVAVLAGVLAVAAVAAGYPALTRNIAAPPAPVIGRQTHNPVLTEGPGSKTTHGPDGLVGSGDVIAVGAVGGDKWQATLTVPGTYPVPGSDACDNFSVTFAADGPGSSICPGTSGQNETDAADPVAMTATVGDGTNYALLGQASNQVAYLIVTFTDGQRLKLTPVVIDKIRYFAWAAPLSMTVASVVVYLGGPYDTNGQTETAVPFDAPGQEPVVTGFHKPGQAVLPRVTTAIGSGTVGGRPWSATAYVGPWGTCVSREAGEDDCEGPQSLSGTEIVGVPDSTTPVAWGSAAPGVVLVKVELADGRTFTVKPVVVGPELLWAFGAADSARPTAVTGYDAAGHQVS